MTSKHKQSVIIFEFDFYPSYRLSTYCTEKTAERFMMTFCTAFFTCNFWEDARYWFVVCQCPGAQSSPV